MTRIVTRVRQGGFGVRNGEYYERLKGENATIATTATAASSPVTNFILAEKTL